MHTAIYGGDEDLYDQLEVGVMDTVTTTVTYHISLCLLRLRVPVWIVVRRPTLSAPPATQAVLT